MEVFPIGQLQIDWTTLTTISKKLLGHSITGQVDNYNLGSNQLARYIVALAGIKEPSFTPQKIMAEPGPILKHLFFSFLVISDSQSVMEILEDTSLSVYSIPFGHKDHRLAIISGTLDIWRSAIINGSSPIGSTELRLFLNKCQIHFEAAGIANLWSSYQKTTKSDQTFALVLKD